MLKKLIAAFLFVCPLVFANWEGDLLKPTSCDIDGKTFYELSSPEHLAWFAMQVNKGNVDYNAILKDDIVIWETPVSALTTEWIPIGTADSKYAGVFDGDGHKISGIYIAESQLYAGLFGAVAKGSVIKNLTLENVSITSSTMGSSTSFSGGIVARFAGDSLLNCEFNGFVRDTNYAAGIAGAILGTSYIGNVRNNGTIEGAYSAGGLIGIAAQGSSTTIKNSVNDGSVSGRDNGGFIGMVYGKVSIDSCANNGDVLTDSAGSSGGFIYGIAKNSSLTSIKNSVNRGHVVSGYESKEGLVVGGFVAVNEGVLEIDNCVNEGKVSKNEKNSGVGGGFVGWGRNNVSITRSVNKGNVYAGRSAGFIGKTDSVGVYLIKDCVNEGRIGSSILSSSQTNSGFVTNATGRFTIDGVVNKVDIVGGLVAGIVGVFRGGSYSYSNSYTSVLNLKNAVNEGNLTGMTNVGGIVGKIFNISKSDHGNYVHQLTNVVNRGHLSLVTKGGCDIGGILSYNSDSSTVMTNVKNYGDIFIYTSPAGAYCSGNGYYGGIVGYGYYTKILDSENHGNIDYIDESGMATKTGYFGGLVGYRTWSVNRSNNYGNIYVQPSADTSGKHYFASGIVGYFPDTVDYCINEGRIEIVGKESYSALAAGISQYTLVAGANINRGNVIVRWASNDSNVAALYRDSRKNAYFAGAYSTADSIMASGKNVAGASVNTCSYMDRSRLGIDSMGQNTKTTSEMQNLDFAWLLNTCNGKTLNQKFWSWNGSGYPVFADDKNRPIYKVSFLDSSKTIRVKTYYIGTSYTDYTGHLASPISEPDPTVVDDELKFDYWVSKGKAFKTDDVMTGDDSLYAVFSEISSEPGLVQFVVEGDTVLRYVLSGKSTSITMPSDDAPGRKLLGWYDGETAVGTIGKSRSFSTPVVLVAKFEYSRYAIDFMNGLDVLQNDSVSYGELPVYKGETPVSKDYEFAGWNPVVAPATRDVRYMAYFTDPNAEPYSFAYYVSSSSVSAVSSSSAKSSSSSFNYAEVIHDPDWVGDALEGCGNFSDGEHTYNYLSSCWTVNAGTAGAVEFEIDDDGYEVLKFWSSYESNKAYALQARHTITLTKGHSYKIVGNGYLFDDATWDSVYVGVMQSTTPNTVYFEHLFSLDGDFESDTYDYCGSTTSATFYINGGARYGGFAIRNVKVEEREIQCPGEVYANQVAYRKNGFKEFLLRFGNDNVVQFLDQDGKVAYSAIPGESSFFAAGGVRVRPVEFTGLDKVGSYIVRQGADTIYKDLVVTDAPYEDILKASLKFFYYQRASMDLDSVYAGVYKRSAGHLDTAVRAHTSTGDDRVFNSGKGWYDAGDYGKYIVNSGITTYTLLALYEHYPNYFKSLKWNIPEEGNLPDLLAEIKYNLDWMLTMQAPDGGVYHKVSGLAFPKTVMPVDDTGKRYAIGKSVTATYDFAAVMAKAYRVYKKFDAVFAEKCLSAAERAYAWAGFNPEALYYANPIGVETGAYEDADASDEYQFASTELYVVTGNPDYKTVGVSGDVPSWQNVYGLANYDKSVYKDKYGASAYEKLIATADKLVENASKGFMVPMTSDDYVWGSNAVAANQGVWLLHAYYMTEDERYYNAAVNVVDYLLGENPLGMSFVTGFGSNSPQNPHHRISQADRIKAPVPGMLVGGPQNKDNSDVGSSCSYSRTYPATAYYDNSCSYATNEVAINWNAPLAYLVGALEALATGETPTFAEIPVYTGSSSSVASSSSVVQSSSSQVKSSSSVASSSSSVKSSSSVAPSSSSQAKSSSSVAPSSSSVKSSSSGAQSSSSQAKSSSSVAPSSSSVKSSSSVAPSSSSETKSSSSSAKSESSSSEAKSSSSSEAESSSSEHTTVAWNDVQPTFNLAVNGMTLTLSNTQGGVVRIFDSLGHLVAAKPLASATTSITLQTPGNYIVRVNGTSRSVTLK